MRPTKADIIKLSGWLAVLVLVFISIGFASKEQRNRTYEAVSFRIDNQFENYFIDEHDMRERISNDGGQIMEGNSVDRLNLREMEELLTAETFISNAQTFRDLKGNLLVRVDQRRPIARIIRNDAPDAYIGNDGEVLPVSDKFTSRVLLVSGDFADSLVRFENISDHYGAYLELMREVYSDAFLRAQIAQLDINKRGEINMYPQVTKQVIEFGTPEEMEFKFRKLEVFYKTILPSKGWNHYKRVNLTYSNQIVCE